MTVTRLPQSLRRTLATAAAAVVALTALPLLTSGPASAAPSAVSRIGRLALPAAEITCGLVGDVPLCSHGDDGRLAPQASAGEGSRQQAGTASTRIGCYGNGRTGARVQTVYARPIGAPDRLPSMRASFRGWAGAIDKAVDDSAHQTRGARHVRFVTKPTAEGCELDIASVSLPPNAFASFNATVSALQQRGMAATGVKYLVWSDAKTLCGMASSYADSSPGASNANNGLYPTYARVDRSCWGYAETHELTHMLGGVQKDAPNATAGFHCRDASDVMCYDDGTTGSQQISSCTSSQSRLLDCRHDDYFSTAPVRDSWLAGHWNVAQSSFLSPVWSSQETAPAPAPAPAEPAGSSQDGTGSEPAPTPSPTPLLPLP